MSYPQRAAHSARRVAYLTTRRRARSNTALFRTDSDGDPAYLSTLQDAPRAPPRLPRSQSHAGRSEGSAQSPCAWSAPAGALAAGDKRFGLDARRRLRRRREFEQLLRRGTRRSAAGYTFYVAWRDAGPPRLGILVTRQHAAAATQRNRIKRCIREAFRLEQEALGPLDVLVRPPYKVIPDAKMIIRLRELLCGLAIR